jgi:hypothetical protein
MNLYITKLLLNCKLLLIFVYNGNFFTNSLGCENKNLGIYLIKSLPFPPSIVDVKIF